MLDLAECFGRKTADRLCRGVLRSKLWILAFQIFEFAVKLVVFSVGQRRRVLLIVRLPRALDYFNELRPPGASILRRNVFTRRSGFLRRSIRRGSRAQFVSYFSHAPILTHTGDNISLQPSNVVLRRGFCPSWAVLPQACRPPPIPIRVIKIVEGAAASSIYKCVNDLLVAPIHVLCVAGPDAGKAFVPTPAGVTLGRESDVNVRDRETSRGHLFIRLVSTRRGELVEVQDRGSSNGFATGRWVAPAPGFGRNWARVKKVKSGGGSALWVRGRCSWLARTVGS